MNARTQILRPIVGALVLPLSTVSPTALAVPDLAFSEVRILDLPPEAPKDTKGISVAVGDLNHDGADDVVIVAAGRGRVVLGNPAGEPGEPIAFDQSLALASYDLELADMNRDGHLDLLIASTSSSQPIVVHLKDGAGNFASANPTGISGARVETADMDADGFADIVTRGPAIIEIHLSTGPLAFATPIATPLTQSLVDVARVSADPIPDILASNELLVSTLSIGAGTVHGISYGLTEADTLVDLNGDGFAEVIVTGREHVFDSYTRFNVLTYTGGVLTETLATTIPVSSPAGVAPLDYDNDGDLDLALTTSPTAALTLNVASNSPPVSAVLLNNDGSGVLTFDRSMPTGGLIGSALAAGNVDAIPGDDLVIASIGFEVARSAESTRYVGRSVALLNTDAPATASPQQLSSHPFSSGDVIMAVFGDINSDGMEDLAVLHSSQVQIRLAISPGVFDERASIFNGFAVRSLRVADVTGDGIGDVVATGQGDQWIYYRVEAQFVPNAPTQFSGYRPNFVLLPDDTRLAREGSQHLADLDNDGDQDWIAYTTNASQNTLTLLIDRRESGAWIRSTQVIDGRIRRILLQDVNQDSAPDLLLSRSADPFNSSCACHLDWRLEVYSNDGQGLFGSPTPLLLTSSEITGVVQGDFAGDARLDVVATTADATVRTFIADATGFHAPVTTSLAPWSMWQPVAADFNLDGELDLVAPVSTDFSAAFITTDTAPRFALGNGSGGFPRVYAMADHGTPPVFSQTYDYNEDAKPDYIALNYFGGVTLYPNLSVPLDCAADANGDLVIDGRDLSLLLSTFGDNAVLGRGADLNADGTIDGADLAVLLAQFETACK